MKLKTRIIIFFRSLMLQAGWNYLRYQGFGFAFTMLPFLRTLYKDKNLDLVLIRYMESFNTNPVMAVFCYGALANLEEETSLSPAKKAGWRVVKTFLTSAAASIGDRLFWGVLRPLSLALGMTAAVIFALDNRVTIGGTYFSEWQGAAVALIVLGFYNLIVFYIKWKGLKVSYSGSRENTFGLLAFNWNSLIKFFKIIGFIMTAALACAVIYSVYAEIAGPYFLLFATAALFIFIIAAAADKYDIPAVYIYFLITAVTGIGAYIF